MRRRKARKIKLVTFAAGTKKTKELKTFEELGLIPELVKAIDELGYESPMPIQEEVIPYLLGEGNDVIALAQTGTGKTAAYGLPLLQKIRQEDVCVQAVVISPTRELCLQIAGDLKDYSKYLSQVRVLAVYGGADIASQMRALRRGVHIIVATPGRLIDLMERGAATLDKVENVVLDEADEMLDMGFSESIDRILEDVPKDRNTLLFSATMSREIEKIARNYLNDPKEIVVGSRNEGAEKVNHEYYLVHARDKYAALKRIVDYYPRIYAIVFCRTRMETQEVADKLIQDGYNAEALHGELSQAQRDLTMQKFRQKRVQLLVATDVAARGLDVDDLTHVINYGFPDDVEYYTHRSGRTGRAGKRGTSICIVHLREKGKIRQIEKTIGKEFVRCHLPSPKDICAKQLFHVIDRLERTEVDEEQIAPFMDEVMRKLDWMDKEDVVKRLVSSAFGRFVAYYANAPQIEEPDERSPREGRERGERGERRQRQRGEGRRGGAVQAEKGFRRLFINVGKRDNVYAREIIGLINKYVRGNVEIGRIDLTANCSFFEVPEEAAGAVLRAFDNASLHGRRIVVDDADGAGAKHSSQGFRHGRGDAPGRRRRGADREPRNSGNDGERGGKYGKDDWKRFFS